MKKLKTMLVLLLWSISVQVVGQTEKPRKNIIQRMFEKGIVLVPVAYYSPETRLAGGLGGFYYFRFNKEDTLTRPSNINLAAIITQNRQLILQLPMQLAFQQNTYLFNGEVGYFKFPFRFYGTGNAIDLDQFETYTPNIVRVKGILYRKLKEKFFVGPRLRYEYQNMQPFEEGGRLANEEIIGQQGGHYAGLGLAMLLDQRNNIFTPTKGSYIEFSSLWANKALGSDYQANEWFLDARKYVPLGKSVLAGQVYAKYITGDQPFYLLAQMGGYYRMRGYFQGAYRDKTYLTSQLEWRFPIIGRFGAAAFGSVGQVSNDLEIQTEHLRFAGGFGLRFRFNDQENINLRIDYAMGKDTSGFYFTIAEAF
ncbi:MAG: BamA/TamA family outer membrane protein [Flammeovirgaceae bacterium]